MRICHVITRLVVGGAQENTVATCIGLRKLGHELDLVTGPQAGPEGSIGEQARQAGVPMIVLPALVRQPHPWLDARAVVTLRALFRRNRYDIVHTHSGKAGVLGRLAARLARVPVVVHTIHGPSFYRYQNLAGNWLFTWIEQLAGEWTTQFVSVADAMTEQYLAAGIGTPSRYVTIHSGMDVAAFEQAVPAEIPGIEDGDVVVGKIARLFRLKGHAFLFEAAPRIVGAVPNVKFLLVGNGMYRERFEREAARLGLADRFIFTGLVPPGDVPRYVARMNVLVHLSLREGLPRALPQALAAGKPVVAFDVDGAREVCLDEQTGILLRPEDAGSLAEAVIRLLQDGALAGKMGAQGRELVREQFSEARMVQRIDELYRMLAAARR